MKKIKIPIDESHGLSDIAPEEVNLNEELRVPTTEGKYDIN